MKIRLRYSLRFLLILVVGCCMLLGILAARNTRNKRDFRELQDRGVLLDTEHNPGFIPQWLASCFPAACRQPKIAWIHYRTELGNIILGDQKFPIEQAKVQIQELVNLAKSVGFEEIRFSRIALMEGMFQQTRFDIRELFPNEGDGRVWMMSADVYSSYMKQNKSTYQMGL